MRTANKQDPGSPIPSDRAQSGTVDAAASRRIHQRAEVELEVTLESEHNFFLGLTENLSEGGLFIATHLLRPIGATVAVSLKLPNSTEPFSAVGTVRWVRQYSETSDTGPGIGIRFEQLSPEHTNMIRGFLAARAPLFHDED